MRPGWADALTVARSVLPHRRMMELDQRLEHAAARPVIVPEMIVCDHGKAFISGNFRSSCRTLGISRPAGSPADPGLTNLGLHTAPLRGGSWAVHIRAGQGCLGGRPILGRLGGLAGSGGW